MPIPNCREICQVARAQWELLIQRQRTATVNSDRAYPLAGKHCRDSDETSDTASNCSLCPWEPQSLLMQLWCSQRQRMLLLTLVGEWRPLVTTGNCFLPWQMAHNPLCSRSCRCTSFSLNQRVCKLLFRATSFTLANQNGFQVSVWFSSYCFHKGKSTKKNQTLNFTTSTLLNLDLQEVVILTT